MADDPVWGSQSELTAAIALADDDVLGRDLSDTTDDATGTVGRVKWRAALGASGLTPGGRLTLESGVPISTTDQTAKGTIYYTPDQHDFIRLYNGTRPHLYQFTERSLALTVTSGKNYDVFLYDNSGTLTLELSAAWTTDTARADALAWQAGVGWVKSGTPTRLHLGMLRASGTNTTEQSFTTSGAPVRQFLWNRYNRVDVNLYCHDPTDSWTYTTATWRQKRASANNQLEFVCGDIGSSWCDARNLTIADGSASFRSGIGLDSTASVAGNSTIAIGVGTVPTTITGEYAGALGLGYHYLSAMEYATASGTTTWYGDAGAPTVLKTALIARWKC